MPEEEEVAEFDGEDAKPDEDSERVGFSLDLRDDAADLLQRDHSCSLRVGLECYDQVQRRCSVDEENGRRDEADACEDEEGVIEDTQLLVEKLNYCSG